MFERILVPLDGSELAVRILLQLHRLLRAGERVSLLLVVDPGHLSERETEEQITAKEELGERLRLANLDLSRYLDELLSAGIQADGEALVGKPAEMILSQARISGLSLIAMGTHGRGGLGRWVRGSVAERVLRRCPVPLLLVNPGESEVPDEPFKVILVPLDGSPRSAAILPLVSRFARVHGSEVVLLRVTPLIPIAPSYPEWGPPVAQPKKEDVLASLETQRAQLASEGVPVRVEALEGDPAECILDAVEREQADLVAMSTHGRSGVGRWLFGSVAEKVLRTCPAPLLVVREE